MIRKAPLPNLLLRAVTTMAMVACGSPAPAASQVPDGAVAAAIERSLRELGAGILTAEDTSEVATLVAAYEMGGFAPLWSGAGLQAELHDVIGEAWQDGLDPDDYFHAAIAPAGGRRTATDVAAHDILSTRALLEFTNDLRWGRARDQATVPPPSPADPAALRSWIAPGRLRGAVDRIRPAHFFYRGLMAARVEMGRIAAAGGWEALPAGRPLRRDSVDARVPLLRRRLVAEGYLSPDRAGGDRFDETVERAVRDFQHRHGLNEDGVVGASTQAELDVPVARRIDQIRVNLERARWVTAGLPDTFVVVNVAGAKVYFVQGGHVALESRVVIGQSYTRTPIFRATIRHVQLSPTWTVPPGIVAEVLAQVRRNPGYLAREGMRVLDRDGREVAPETIDFHRWSASAFPYVFRQDPGPLNPLGGIKLVFPNADNVYLHDTPAKALFAREQRMFSHGCIRVQDPLALAELVLADPAWTQASLSDVIGLGKTRDIPLRRPLEVVIQYWTASADEAGALHFYRDVYGRDAAVLAALDG